MRQLLAPLTVIALLAGAPVFSATAGEVVVLKVAPTKTGVKGDARLYRFSVTVKHADTGWEHYADAWRVLAHDGPEPGKVLGVRTLYHPHVDEQPFTRALGGVAIPAGVTKVDVQARDKVHGWGAKVTVRLDGATN